MANAANPHEDSDFSSTGGNPVGVNVYSQPLIGQTLFQFNPYNRMVSPTTYTHPRTFKDGGIAKGKVYAVPKDLSADRQMKTMGGTLYKQDTSPEAIK